MRDLAGLQADARNFEARMKELIEAKEALTAQFHEVGAKLLSEAQKQFLERADARFNQASEKSDAQLKALLQPVEATLKRYEEGLSKVEKERVGSYEALREAVTLLHAGHSQVRDETAQAGQRAALQPQGARPLGRAEPQERARAGRPLALCRLSVRGVGRHRGRPAAPRRDRAPARRPQADHRRQMLAERLPRRQRGGRRGGADRSISRRMRPRSASTPRSSARRIIGTSSATPPIMSSCTFPASIS